MIGGSNMCIGQSPGLEKLSLHEGMSINNFHRTERLRSLLSVYWTDFIISWVAIVA